MAEELLDIVKAFHEAYLIAEVLKLTSERTLEMFTNTVSMTVLYKLTTRKWIDEKGLMNDLFSASQAYKKFEMSGVSYIREVDHPINDLIKLEDYEVLLDVLSNSPKSSDWRKWIHQDIIDH